MKIVVAISNIHDALFICEASKSSCKSDPKAESPGFFLTDPDLYYFILNKFPLSTAHWTHIDLDTEL